MNDWYFKPDDVSVNRLWGFDYAFCCGDCKNKECGRNPESNSYKEMIKSETVYTASDFSSMCKRYRKEKHE